MEGDGEKDSRHGFSQLWVGPKWFLFILAAVLLTALAAAAWFICVEGEALPAGAVGARFLLYPMAAAYGLAHGGAALLTLWFFGYALQEVKTMIAEQFKEQRFQKGLAQGRAQERVDRDREWQEYLARQAAAEREGVPFN